MLSQEFIKRRVGRVEFTAAQLHVSCSRLLRVRTERGEFQRISQALRVRSASGRGGHWPAEVVAGAARGAERVPPHRHAGRERAGDGGSSIHRAPLTSGCAMGAGLLVRRSVGWGSEVLRCARSVWKRRCVCVLLVS